MARTIPVIATMSALSDAIWAVSFATAPYPRQRHERSNAHRAGNSSLTDRQPRLARRTRNGIAEAAVDVRDDGMNETLRLCATWCRRCG